MRHDDSARHFLANEFLSFDLLDRLGQIRCPVAVLAGELDPIVTLEDAEELAQAISSEVRLVRFPNAGHGLIGEHRAVLDLIREITFAAVADNASPISTRLRWRLSGKRAAACRERAEPG